MARRINKHNAMTVISATILIGTELVAVAAAGGWALANLLDLGRYGMYGLQAFFMIGAAYGIYAFFRSGVRAEPIYEGA